MIDGLETALESPLSSPSSLSVRVASLHSPRTSTYLVWRAKFTRNTQWNLIFRAHTFVFGHLTHHLPSSAIVRLFDTILRLLIEKGIISPFESLLRMRDANEISGRSPLKREIISDEERTLSRDSSFSSRERDSFPSKFTTSSNYLPEPRSKVFVIETPRSRDIYFRLEDVKYGKNICLSDGIFGA